MVRVRIVGAGRRTWLDLTSGDGPLVRFSASNGGVNNMTLHCASQAGSSGLRVAPENEAQTGTRVDQNFNSFHDLLIYSCADTGIALRAGPGERQR